MILIKNGKIVTVTKGTLENGCVLIKDGKILEISEDIKVNEDVEVIDAKGGWVTPGFIDAHCHIGIFEQDMGFEGMDINEATDPLTPHLRAIDAINPMDTSFKDAIKGGVTTVMTGPGSANPMGGQFVAMKTSGICVDDMVV
ncbi:amidohydrolase, partial [Clostridium botulinum C/D]|nr:amidohydrolase [Clostridium botulinum C/D]